MGLVITPAGSSAFPGTLVIASGKTFTVNNTLTLAGTDATTMTFPTTNATLARTDAGQTFTGVQVMTSPTINTSLVFGNGQGFLDNAADVTALSRGANPQTLRIGNTVTTPGTAGEWFKILCASNVFRFGAAKGSSSGTARVASWDYGGTEASPVAAITVPITSGSVTFGGGINAAGRVQITGASSDLYLSSRDATGDFALYGAGAFLQIYSSATGATVLQFKADGTLSTWPDGSNFQVGTSTGSKLGTTTSQKLGFWNATPVSQQSRVGQLTDSTTGTPSTTLVDVGVVFSQASINNNFSSVLTKLNALDSLLHTLGLSA